MLEYYSFGHFFYIIVSIVLIVLGMIICSKGNKKVQNLIFIITAFTGSFGIFFRYGLNLHFGKITLEPFITQMLQVCNFNFVVMLLALIPGNKLGRNYLFMFSMLGASTVYFSFSKSLTAYRWYDITVINFFANHFCAIALPLFMLASKRYKPEKKYIIPVTLLIIMYFFMAYVGGKYLMEYKNYPIERTFSFVFRPQGNYVFETLYKWIPHYFIYLLPLAPVLMVIFYIECLIFKNREYKKF